MFYSLYRTVKQKRRDSFSRLPFSNRLSIAVDMTANKKENSIRENSPSHGSQKNCSGIPLYIFFLFLRLSLYLYLSLLLYLSLYIGVMSVLSTFYRTKQDKRHSYVQLCPLDKRTKEAVMSSFVHLSNTLCPVMSSRQYRFCPPNVHPLTGVLSTYVHALKWKIVILPHGSLP